MALALIVLFVSSPADTYGQIGYGVEESGELAARAAAEAKRQVEAELEAARAELDLDDREPELDAPPPSEARKPGEVDPGASIRPDAPDAAIDPATGLPAVGAAAVMGPVGPPTAPLDLPELETGRTPVIRGTSDRGADLDAAAGSGGGFVLPRELLVPPEEARLRSSDLRGPRRVERQDADIHLWTFSNSSQTRLHHRRAPLMSPASAEVARSYYLPVSDDRRDTDVTVDLEKGVVSQTQQVGDVVIEPGRTVDLERYSYENMVMGRWDGWCERARSGVGRELDESSFINAEAGRGVEFGTEFNAGPMEPILGKGEASITIRGSERITVAGTSSWDANLRETDNVRQSKFPQLDLRQDLNIQVDGQVGDKVTIDWKEDSNAETSLANRISIRYRGYDDEVISTMDLGNTSLSLPGTGFVSYNGSHRGLFGIKTTGKLGDYDLTLIASKQEGQTASSSSTGRAQQTENTPEDWRFIQRRFFFLVDPVDPLLTGTLVPPPITNAGGPPPPESAMWIPPPEISNLTVWLDDNISLNNAGLPDGHLFLDPTRQVQLSEAPVDSVEGVFDVMTEQEDYTLRNDLFTLRFEQDGVEQIYRYPVLDMRSPLNESHRLGAVFNATFQLPTVGAGGAVTYRDTTITYGILPVAADDDRLRAKAIYLAPGDYPLSGEFYDSRDHFFPVRNQELRNVYTLGGTDIDLKTLELNVQTRDGEQREHLVDNPDATFLRMLGVDREDEFGNPGFDGLIDRGFLFPFEGLLVLPDLRPFAPAAIDSVWPFHYFDLGIEAGIPDPAERPAYFLGELSNRAPYDKKTLNIGTDARYRFHIKFSTPQTQFPLQAAGTVLEGSETVTIDGQRLNRGSDYRIDYELGIVTLTGAAENLLPESEVQIDFAYAPLFALGQKTLMGASLGWTPDPSRRMGATFLFESAGVAERRPKLGEEPSRTLVGDINGGISTRPQWMTRLVDGVPGLRANSDSRFELDGEVALSFPNPNTRGQVYIDDFEGAKETSSLTINREQWFWASRPVSIEDAPGEPVRGDLVWYNPVISPVHEGDLFPDLDEVESRDRKQVLMMRLTPEENAGLPPEEQWFGITQGVSSTGVDFTRKQFIEIWVNDYNFTGIRNSDARMIVDMGNISEDADMPGRPPNQRRDTEDQNRDGLLDLNEQGLFEDTGLDSLRSPEEPGYNPDTNPDPAGDDFEFDRQLGENAFNFEAYAAINSFEENRQLDDEDVNRDNSFVQDSQNNYIQFSMSLADTAQQFVATNVRDDFGAITDRDGRDNGWRLYRIPLEASTAVNTPALGSVRHLRVWFTGIREPSTIQIASIDIQGNLYQIDPLRADGVPVEPAPGEFFKLRGINNKEDANEYVPPFELEQRDRVTEREGALALDFLDLAPGHEGTGFRAFSTDRDYTLYQELRWFVYAGEDTDVPGAAIDSVEAFVRFGADTLNYYEYAVPFIDVPSPRWFEIAIPVTDLSDLKSLDPDSTVSVVIDGRVLKLVGSPSFTRVRKLTFGVRNISSRPRSGTIWVNDLRLDDVIRDVGAATRFNVNMDFSDFLRVSSDLTTQDEDFLSIGSSGRRQVSRGTGSRRRDFGLRTTMNAHKFIERTGFSLPLTYTFRDNLELPLFRVGDDVVLDPVQSEDQRRGSRNTTLAASLSRSKPNSSVFTRFTFNALRTDFSLRDASSLTQTRRDSSRAISFNASYSPPTQEFRPLQFWKAEMRYFPESITTGMRFTSDRRFNFSRDLDNADARNLVSSVYTKNVFLNGAANYTPVRSIRTGYRIDSRRDLISENRAGWLFGLNVGAETQRTQNADISWSPPLPRLQPTLSFRGGSRDDHDPNLQQVGFDEQIRNLGATQSLSAGLVVPLTVLTGSGARRAPGAPGGPFSGLHNLFARVGRFNDIRVSGALNQSRDFQFATGVPRWQYYLGFSMHPGPDVELTNRGREDRSKNRTANASTTIDLNGGLTTTASYGFNRRETWSSFTDPRVSESQSWPDLDFSWRQLHQRFPMMRRYVRNLTLDSGFRREMSVSGPRTDPTQVITERADWNPIFSLNGTFTSGWTARVQMTASSTHDERNTAGLGQFTDNRRRRLTISFSKRYTQRSGFKLPWQSKPIDLKGDLSLNFDIDRSSDLSESGGQSQPATVQRDNTNTSFRAGSTYAFRRNIDANMSFNFGRNNDNKSGRKRRTLSLTMSMNFRF